MEGSTRTHTFHSIRVGHLTRTSMERRLSFASFTIKKDYTRNYKLCPSFISSQTLPLPSTLPSATLLPPPAVVDSSR